jgi:Trk-type K+ transport system membrane component
VVTWLLGYIAIVAVFVWLMMWSEPQLSAERLIIETTSAVSNVGMSFDQILTSGGGLDLMSAAMVIGRVAGVGVLWWMVE